MSAVISLLVPTGAHAAVAVLLEQPYGGLGAWNPTGHSAVYFDHVCAASPTELRACGPGELGVVISRYDGIGKYDWIAIPLIPYLYAVQTSAEIPSSVDRLDVLRMRDLYRREHLEAVAADTAEGGMPQGNWYELVGSAYDRTIFGFQVKTTPEQDAEIIALFNDRPNVTRYDGAFRNCADFARLTINLLYPHAVRRNLIADFGLTTPKSVARALTHYAEKHPETALEVFRVPQVPGSIPRSTGVQGVTESLLKRYGVPLVVLSPQVTAAILVAYIGHGRFSMPKDASTLDVAALEAEAGTQKGGADAVAGAPAPPMRVGAESAGVLGSSSASAASVSTPASENAQPSESVERFDSVERFRSDDLQEP